MLEADELDANPVFRALQSQYVSYFRWAQDKCGLVCVPYSRSVHGVELNKEFIEKHTFRPSPLFKDQYLTRDSKHPATVSVEEEHVVTLDGYPEKRTAKIISEELGYNKRSETFRILIIDQPLVGASQLKANDDGYFYDSPTVLSYTESQSYLSRFPGGQQVFTALNAEIQKFCNNYMILPGFLDHATEKLKGIWTGAAKGFLSCLEEKNPGSAKFLIGRVQLAVESYLLGSVNGKLFPKVCENSCSDDARLEKKCEQLKELTPTQIGIPSTIQCDLSLACEKLSTLDSCVCTFDKMLCIKEVLDLITESVKNGDNKKDPELDDGFLTSDQYLPLLASVIVMQRSHHIVSNIYYLDKFQFYSRPSDSLSFSLVTFKAAYSYLESLNPRLVAPVKPNSPENKKTFISPKANGSISRSVSLQSSSSTSSSSSSSASQKPLTRLDRELDRITQMVKAPTQELADISQVRRGATGRGENSGLSQSMRKASSSSLGEFLSSLQDDKRGVSFGKQT